MDLSWMFCGFCKGRFLQDKMKKCGRCKSVYYCSADCQKSNWATHKPSCALPEPPTTPKHKSTDFDKIFRRIQEESSGIASFRQQHKTPKESMIRLKILSDEQMQMMLDDNVPISMSLPNICQVIKPSSDQATLTGIIKRSVWDERHFFIVGVATERQMVSCFMANVDPNESALMGMINAKENGWTLETIKGFMSKALLREFASKRATNETVDLYIKIMSGCPCGRDKICYHGLLGLT
jgi:hypothetical protein